MRQRNFSFAAKMLGPEVRGHSARRLRTEATHGAKAVGERKQHEGHTTQSAKGNPDYA